MTHCRQPTPPAVLAQPPVAVQEEQNNIPVKTEEEIHREMLHQDVQELQEQKAHHLESVAFAPWDERLQSVTGLNAAYIGTSSPIAASDSTREFEHLITPIDVSTT